MARSSHHPTPLGCTQTLIIAIFPVLIYLCQWFDKANSVATCLAGMLLALKTVVELRSAHQQPKHPRVLHPRSAHLRRRVAQQTVAGCYFCEEVCMLQPDSLEGMRVGVCQKCSTSLRLLWQRR